MRLVNLGAVAFTLCIAASAVQATPCVGSDFTTPFPGASNVTTHVVDVPSPRFPGFWQEGTKDGYFYTLFANGDAVLTAGRDSTWQIAYGCDAALGECAAQIEGTPPDAAMQVAEQLKQCMLEGEVSQPVEEPEPAPVEAAPSEEEVASDPSVEPVPPIPPQVSETCIVDTIDDENPTRQLQRMLVEAGADPGPLDGIPGAMTTNALIGILGETAAQLPTEDAIVALRELICSDTDR